MEDSNMMVAQCILKNTKKQNNCSFIFEKME